MNTAYDRLNSSPSESGVRVFSQEENLEGPALVLDQYFRGEHWLDDQDEAYPHQQEVFFDISEALAMGYNRGYVELPTSTGKTYLIAKLAEIFANSGLRVLILADMRAQVSQLSGDIEDKGLAKFAQRLNPKDVGRHYGGSKATTTDKVVVATYAGMNNFAQTGELGEFDVILADEAHKSLGAVTKRNIISMSPGATKIGFTATPKYRVGKTVNEIFERPMHELSLKEAIENDLVAPVTCLLYTTDAEIPDLDEYADEYTQRELERLIDLKARNDSALEFARNFVADGRQGIISCVPGENSVHARSLADELDGSFVTLVDGTRKFVRAKAVGSFLSQAENQRILQAYENGQVDVLTYVKAIAEGWDSSVASFLIATCPTTSRVRKTQELGRVLRKKAGNLESIIVDFMDVSPNKFQYTSLDVMDEKSVHLGRVIGSEPSSNGRPTSKRTNLERIINSELWLNLLANDAFLLKQLRVKYNSKRTDSHSRDIRRYNQILEKEHGLPEEPKNSVGFPATVATEIGRFMRRYVREQRILPELEDIQGFIEHKNLARQISTQDMARLALSGFDAYPLGLGLQVVDAREPDEQTTEELAEEDILIQEIATVLDSLPSREAIILKLRFGFDGKQPHTLDQVGAELDITRERVRQLESQALARLASLTQFRNLASDSGGFTAPKIPRTDSVDRTGVYHARSKQYETPSNNWEEWQRDQSIYNLQLLELAGRVARDVVRNSEIDYVIDEIQMGIIMHQIIGQYDLVQRIEILDEILDHYSDYSTGYGLNKMEHIKQKLSFLAEAAIGKLKINLG